MIYIYIKVEDDFQANKFKKVVFCLPKEEKKIKRKKEIEDFVKGENSTKEREKRNNYRNKRREILEKKWKARRSINKT